MAKVDVEAIVVQALDSLKETMGPGVVAIARERRRQQVEEGWTAEHDDEHDVCEIAYAAHAYLIYATWQADPQHGWTEEMVLDHILENHWPWDESYFKPAPDPTRNFVKAAALIAAEIDRLERAA